MLEKTLESLLNCKEIKPVHPKGNPSWIFTRRTDAEAESPLATLKLLNSHVCLVATTKDSSEINHFYYCRKFSWATLPVPQRERHLFPYQREFTLFHPSLRLLTQYQGHGHMEHIELILIFFLSLSIPQGVLSINIFFILFFPFGSIVGGWVVVQFH